MKGQAGFRDIAVVGPHGAYLSSIGTVFDGIARVDARARALYVPPYRVAVESRIHVLATTEKTVHLAGGRTLPADAEFSSASNFQMVYVAAFEALDEAAMETALTRERRLIEWLRLQQASGAVIGAADSAVFLLAEAGLLDKGRAALPRSLSELFRRRYRRIQVDTRATVVEHSGIFTAGTPANEWLLVARLVERSISPMMSRWLATTTGLQRIRDNSLLASDPLVAAAQFWIGERFSSNFRIGDMARDLAVSHATLIRRFMRGLAMTPQQYVRMLRIDAAKSMLSTTSRPVEQIGMMSGYADARAFRAAFREQVGMTPTEFRTRLGR